MRGEIHKILFTRSVVICVIFKKWQAVQMMLCGPYVYISFTSISRLVWPAEGICNV